MLSGDEGLGRGHHGYFDPVCGVVQHPILEVDDLFLYRVTLRELLEISGWIRLLSSNCLAHLNSSVGRMCTCRTLLIQA